MKPEYPSSIIHHPSSIIHLRILNIILILALVISIADPARAGSSQATGASFAWQAVDLAGMGAEYRQYLGQTWRAITQWLGDLLPEEDPTILTLRSETEIANPGDVVRIYWEMSGPDIPKTIDLTLHLPRAFEVYDGMVEAEANPTPSVTPTEEPTAAPTDAIPPTATETLHETPTAETPTATPEAPAVEAQPTATATAPEPTATLAAAQPSPTAIGVTKIGKPWRSQTLGF